MALVSMRQLLDHAAENGYGLPAFNVNNLEQVQAIMEAASETDSPVIMQASAGARKYAGETFLKYLIEAAVATYPKTPVAMHQDHGQSPAVCEGAIKLGFSSVMMDGSLEAIGFRTEAGLDGVEARGTLWGGNLAVLCSLLGTPHFPKIKGGILFLEDVNEHPYRVERMLLQLWQAGVLDAQKAVILGSFSGWKKSPLDRGYSMKSCVQALRERVKVPVLTGLPFGHVPTKVCLPVGAKAEMMVEGRDVIVAWGHVGHGHDHHDAHDHAHDHHGHDHDHPGHDH